MATMLNIYDRATRKKTAVLQNAFDIVETHELNQIYTLSFSLPSTDEKNQFCQPRHFVRWGDTGELYRIKEPKVSESNVGVITYECEHVITTLCDSIMFGSYQYGGASVKTRATITWLLSQQKQQDWVLDVCEFDRKFEYLWEQENILNALYSVPKEFAAPYKWTFDTTVYPWKLSLRAINTTIKPEYYLRAKSNILSSGTSADYANICTRIYPLGYGEGVNQLDIKEVNNGVPYLQSPLEYTNKYGIIEKVLVDRRFENAESLKAYAQSMLDLYQEPSMSRTFDVTDLYPLTAQSWDDAEVGKICRMTQDNTTAYITKTRHTWDKAGDLQIELSTKATDIASNVADLADRVRIESVYAQGATQLYQHSKDANATPTMGMVMSLYFPSEMRQINKVLMRLKLNRFRSYSQTTESNGGFEKTYTVSAKSQTITSQTNTQNSSVTVTEKALDITTQTNTEDTSVTVRSSALNITSQTNTADTSVTVRQAALDITSQTNTEDSSVTVRQAALDITSQTNTQNSSVTVTEKALDITTQTNTEDSSVTVRSSSLNITSQTNTEDTSVTVRSQDSIVTTDMMADADQNLTTTKAGGGTGETSTDGWGTIDVSFTGTAVNTDEANWTYTSDPYTYNTELGVSVSTQNSGHHHNVLGVTYEKTPPASLNYKHDHTMNLNTDVDAYGTQGEGGSHNHSASIVNPDYEDGHHHTIRKNSLQHYHAVNVNVSSNVSEQSGFAHTHQFHIGPHQHELNIAHTHKVTVPGQTLNVPCPKHKHDITVPSQTLSIPCPKHKHDVKVPGQTLSIPCPKHKHNITIPSQTLSIPCPKHKHDITIPAQTLSVPCPKHKHDITVPAQTLSIPCPKHKHDVKVPAQTLSIPCPKHKHDITIPGHEHTITIPPHTHGINPGIFESGNATSFDIYVQNKKKTTVNATSYDGDITTWLLNDKNQVPRDQWIDVEIRPNDLAYVVSSVFVQGFVQSRGGGNY